MKCNILTIIANRYLLILERKEAGERDRSFHEEENWIRCLLHTAHWGLNLKTQVCALDREFNPDLLVHGVTMARILQFLFLLLKLMLAREKDRGESNLGPSATPLQRGPGWYD